MIEFVLNDKTIKTNKPSEMVLLDFIREEQNLKGTKTACREGDCGACTVIEGSLIDNVMQYKTIVACLTPLANIRGKHIVTIEGINNENLTPIQEIFIERSATQCGFCTPGFIVSLTNIALSDVEITKDEVINSISGNICRCTGYKSIIDAADRISNKLINKNSNRKIDWLISNNYIPAYFKDIPEKIKALDNKKMDSLITNIIAGGTDLFVQNLDEILKSKHNFIANNKKYKGISIKNNICEVGSATTVAELEKSDILKNIFPKIKDYLKLISSTQIRNMATIGGNFVNASPIGDLSVFFIALNAKLHISNNNKQRSIYLKDFFIDYKKVDLKNNELIEKVSFQIHRNDFLFNFEKVSKRTHLDIASVNSAIFIKIENKIIKEAHISAGGLAAIPKYLEKASKFLLNKKINDENINNAVRIATDEVKPISDIRGSKEYKLLLLKQLIYAHFKQINK